MPSAQMSTTIDNYVNAWNAMDIEALQSCLADNAEWADLSVQRSYTTKEEFRAHHDAVFKAMSNPKMEVIGTAGNDTDFASTEWTMSFNYTTQSPMLPLPATGQEIKMVGVALNWFDKDGKIVRSRNYGRFLGDAGKV